MSKYKTNRDALKILTKRERELLQRNAENLRKQPFKDYTDANYRIDYIQSLFEWKLAPEGHSYWFDINAKWELEFLKQKSSKNGST